ncbi:hypothetical protein H3J60_004535 [Salmonella enterica]|nr:hypothetical protein [Salmonella enterica]
MIVRFGGGNSGIGEYLEKGRKAERDYSRDELDHRLILDGDLALTETIINSIEDKGQERYLHITLSFHESEVSEETLKAVTQEYKSLLMNAYHDEEYSFYAEAHLPKLSHIADHRTGEMIERKPHIHIVIPRLNLVTDRALNPAGDITHKVTQERLDGIQEHINNKYGLVSPKDGVRISDENHAAVLSRAKGDLFRERNNQQKNEIFRRIDKENVRSFEGLTALLSEYGEVRTRNAGKENEYLAVKLNGDAKFTNLKNPIFSKLYIEERRLPLVKPTQTQIKNRVDGWVNQTSHEIKHIYSKGEKLREHYKALSPDAKADFLKERISQYDRENKIDSGNSAQPRGRQRSQKPGAARHPRLHRSETGIGLPRMSSRTMVYGIPGRESGETADTVTVLPGQSRGDLAEQPEKGKYSGEELRRTDDGRGRVGETVIADSNPVVDMYLRHIDRSNEKNDAEAFAVIKKEIEPQRFLSYLKDKYNIIPSDHKVSYAQDGSPRFRADKRNLNASDFLTKKMNLSWDEAKIILTDIYNQQLQNKPFARVDNKRSLLSSEAAEKRRQSLSESRNEIRGWVRNERKELFAQIKDMRTQLRDISKHQRSLAEGVIVYTKLTGLERIKEREKQSRNAITRYHSHWNERSENMQTLDRLKTLLDSDTEDGIKPDSPRHNLKHAVEAQVRVEEMRGENQQLKDLVMDKGRFGVDYRDMQSQQVVFSDKGNHVVAGKNPTDKEIGLMMDYAKEKYGGVLKLTGSEDFKTRCANVAAENGLNVILKPKEFHEVMVNKRQELELAKQDAVQATTADKPAASAEPAADGIQQASKEQLRAAVESLPEVTSPSQLKAAIVAAAATAAASSQAQAEGQESASQALPGSDAMAEAAEAGAATLTGSADTQEVSREQLRAVVESLPDRVSPSQLRDALIAASSTADVTASEGVNQTQAAREIAVEDTPELAIDNPSPEIVPAQPETAPDDVLKYAIEDMPPSVSPGELKQTIDGINQQHNANVSLQGIREISPESLNSTNASTLEKDMIPGTAGVLRDVETDTYDVLVAMRDADGDTDVYTFANVQTSEQATRLAMLVNNQEPAALALAMRDDLAQQHTQSEQATKFGLNTSEANAMATVAQINRDVPGINLDAATLRDFHAGSFTVEKTDPFSNNSSYQIVGATKDLALGEQAGDIRVVELADEVQAKNAAYELNGLNTDSLSSAMDKQGRYEAMTSFDQLKNGIRDANFAEALPVDIDSESVQYKEIAPNTWNIEVPDSTGQGHVLLGGFKGNEDYARLVMDKVTRIDLNALGEAMEHRAHDKESHDLHQAQEAAEKQVHKQDDFGME